jgi:hypothetical protein
MHGFPICQSYNPQHSVSELRYDAPKTNPSVWLNHASNRLAENSLALIHVDVRPLAQHLLAKVPGRLHARYIIQRGILSLLRLYNRITMRPPVLK